MRISTNEFCLDKHTLFKINLLNYARKRSWLLALLLLIVFLLLLIQDRDLLIFCTILIPIVIGYIIFFYWRHSTSEKNLVFFKKRRYEFTDEFFFQYLEDGSEGKINYENINMVARRKDYFLLYISQTQFFYVPVKCFASDKDRAVFDEFLRSRKL